MMELPLTKPVTPARDAVESAPAILVIGPLPPPYHGGAVATSFVLHSELAARFRMLHLDTADRRGLHNIGRLDPRNVLLAVRHAAILCVMLLRHRPRLVYLPMAQNTLGVLRDCALLLCALLLRRRFVVHLHGGGFREFCDGAPAALRVLVTFILRRAARVIVLGESLRSMVDGMVPPDRVAVLPNGTEDVFGGQPDRSGRAGPVRLLFLGNLMSAKGFPETIEAVAALRRDGVAVELHAAGDFTSEPERRAALTQVRQLGDAVVLHGVVTGARKKQLLEEADVLVLPSHSEGHPYVVLEAMAAGLPVVATSLPTLAETVIDGETGLLVPPRDGAALLRALRTLIADGQSRTDLGRAGRRRYERHYSLVLWSRGLHDIMRGAAA